jgi:uncharacterized membrane protein
MPPDHDWYGPPYAGPHWSPFGQFMAASFAALFWLLVLGVITWAVVRYLQRAQGARMPALSEEPSAMELLRKRYVLGQLDVDAFEEMVTHLLASEQRERTYAPPLDKRSWSE